MRVRPAFARLAVLGALALPAAFASSAWGSGFLKKQAGGSITSAQVPDPYTVPDGTWNLRDSLSFDTNGGGIRVPSGTATSVTLLGVDSQFQGMLSNGARWWTFYQIAGPSGSFTVGGNVLTDGVCNARGDGAPTKPILNLQEDVAQTGLPFTLRNSAGVVLTSLDVSGGLSIGDTTMAMNAYKEFTSVIDVPSIAANTVVTADATCTGAALGDSCSLGFSTDPTVNTVTFTCAVRAANTCTLSAHNDGSVDDPASRTYTFRTFR